MRCSVTVTHITLDDVFQVQILTSQQLLTNNNIIMKYKKWTEKRCIEIIKVMNQFPDNLTAGFEECAKKFGGTPLYYNTSWYKSRHALCKLRKKMNSLVCTILSTTSPNYKNSPRVNGKFRSERAERIVPTTAEFFKGWISSCTKAFQ